MYHDALVLQVIWNNYRQVISTFLTELAVPVKTLREGLPFTKKSALKIGGVAICRTISSQFSIV